MGANGRRLTKVSVDSGVESDYADIGQINYDKAVPVHSSSRSMRSIRKDETHDEHVDQFGYVIVLPARIDEGKRAGIVASRIC